MDKRDPIKCNQEVYKNGEEVFFTHTIASKDMETLVSSIEKESGQQVDWHYACGRAILLAIGDLQKVKEAIKHHYLMHDQFYRNAVKKYLPECSDEFIANNISDIWQYNITKYKL